MNLAAFLPHLLRPYWLIGLLLLPVVWWLWRLRQRASNPWRHAVDAHLLPHLLESSQAPHRATPLLLMTALAIALFALAGPAWRREETPLIEPIAPLVIALDLSSSMLAADLPPSRNARMRIKLLQLIAQRRGGQLGLVAYAGAAFTVAPLSDDAHSLSELIDALLPSVMPVDGQRADLAIARSAALLKQAGFAHGQILLLTDRADAAAQSAARTAAANGYATSVLGVGTLGGAPVAGSDGFVNGDDGRIRMPRLDAVSLRALAAAGNGGYTPMTSQASDIAALDLLDPHEMVDEHGSHRAGETAAHWRDDGPWLVLVLLPLLLAGFRRGWLVAIELLLAIVPTPHAEAASHETNRDWWSGLWQRDDQRAYHALQQGHPVQARALAKSPQIAAAAAYRAGDYAAAAQAWSQANSADTFYNHGNALTQLHRYPQAIQSYDRALVLQPDMHDAISNRNYVQQLLQQQKREQAQNHPDQPKDHRGNQHGEGQQQQGQQQQGQPQQEQQQQEQQQQQQQGQQQPSQHQQSQPDQSDTVSADSATQRQRQAQADAATQRALQQALQRKQAQPNARRDGKARLPAESEAQREQRDAIEQWLRQVPDDPGGLLRRKFALEYQRRQAQGEQ